MAKSERQIDELRERLNRLLADWGTEISAVLSLLEGQQSQSSAHSENAQALENQSNELTKLRQRVRERDMALDHLTKSSKERDARFAELEKDLKGARTRLEELERQPKAVPQDEVEAMRAELAARKLLVKSMRTDADRAKALEKEHAENRDLIAKLKVTVDRHAKTIAELRRGSEGWERKYRELSEVTTKRLSRESDGVPRPANAGAPAAQPKEFQGTKTVVIDMAEPLRKANDERRRRTDKR